MYKVRHIIEFEIEGNSREEVKKIIDGLDIYFDAINLDVVSTETAVIK